MGSIIPKKGGDSKYNPETLASYNTVYAGVIMINGLNLSFDLISQRVALVRDNGVITSTYLAIALKDRGIPDYFNYLFKSFDNQKVFHSWGKGLRATLSYNILKSEFLIFPPLSEQEAIASWLDGKCGEIDELIDVEQKMIDELEAYRQATITETVTRGLNPAVPMRQTGISWIPEIPEHWEIKKLKFSCSIKGRIGFRGYTNDDIVQEGEGAITLSPSNMRSLSMDFRKLTYLSWHKYFESPEIMIKNGDVLMVKTGSTYGKVSYVDNLPLEATINPQIVVLKDFVDNSKYIMYVMASVVGKMNVEGSVVGGTIPTIAQEKILNYIIPHPPLSEQRAIADYLDTKCKEIDDLIAVKREKIETLKQYRQSIIFEAVTGKLQIC